MKARDIILGIQESDNHLRRELAKMVWNGIAEHHQDELRDVVTNAAGKAMREVHELIQEHYMGLLGDELKANPAALQAWLGGRNVGSLHGRSTKSARHNYQMWVLGESRAGRASFSK